MDSKEELDSAYDEGKLESANMPNKIKSLVHKTFGNSAAKPNANLS